MCTQFIGKIGNPLKFTFPFLEIDWYKYFRSGKSGKSGKVKIISAHSLKISVWNIEIWYFMVYFKIFPWMDRVTYTIRYLRIKSAMLCHICVISPRCPNGGGLQVFWMDYKRIYWESLGTPIFSWDSIFQCWKGIC